MTRRELAEKIFNLSVEWQNRSEYAVKIILKELTKGDK